MEPLWTTAPESPASMGTKAQAANVLRKTRYSRASVDNSSPPQPARWVRYGGLATTVSVDTAQRPEALQELEGLVVLKLPLELGLDVLALQGIDVRLAQGKGVELPGDLVSLGFNTS
jgi:hypothetical protein